MFRAKWYIAVILVLGLLLTGCRITWGEVREIQMQLSLEEGAAYRILITTEQYITQTFEGEETAIEQMMGFEMRYLLRETDADGNIWVDLSYERIMMQMSSGGEMLQYDSDDTTADVPSEFMGFGMLIGKGFSMLLTPDGEVLAVDGIEAMLDDIMEDLGLSEAEAEYMRQILGEQFNEQTLKEQMGNITIDYPEGIVRIGDTWTSQVVVSGQLPVVVNNVYTLQGYADNIATVSVTSTIQTDAAQAVVDAGLYQISYDLEGAQQGTMQIDVQTGLTSNSMVTQTISGSMVFSMDDMEMVVPISMISYTSVQMLKD